MLKAISPAQSGGVGTGTVTQVDTGAGLTGGPITTNGTISANATLLTKMGTVSIITPSDVTLVLISYSEYAFTITQLNNLVTSSGNITAAIQINGINVTGLSSLLVTSVAQNPSASAANSVNIGDNVTLVLSSNSSASNLQFTMKGIIS